MTEDISLGSLLPLLQPVALFQHVGLKKLASKLKSNVAVLSGETATLTSVENQEKITGNLLSYE